MQTVTQQDTSNRARKADQQTGVIFEDAQGSPLQPDSLTQMLKYSIFEYFLRESLPGKFFYLRRDGL